jgi:hypothetical protein
MSEERHESSARERQHSRSRQSAYDYEMLPTITLVNDTQPISVLL